MAAPLIRIEDHPFILASASPRRQELLSRISLTPDEISPADIDETRKRDEKPADLAGRLAREKARVIAAPHSESFILAADTVAAAGRRELTKPETEEQARAWLRLLSGRRHRIHGGICLISPDGRESSRIVTTMVQFKRLSAPEIEGYLATGEWDGKAGGYAIQGYAELFVKAIQGSHSNVVGLSLYDVMQLMIGAGMVKWVRDDKR